MEVDTVLFPRNDLEHVGLAPLTSMYQFGPLERPDVDDFRPRVHDSDGLLIRSQTEEWLWRPLANPERLQVSSFQVGDVRGFGLAQRARNPEDYQDLEAKYHRRPSLWVEPLSGWPPGAVDLIEIPTPSEFNDNIVAYWRPKEPLPALKPFAYSYSLNWAPFLPRGFGLLRITGSRSGSYADNWRHFVIDFAPDEPDPDLDVSDFVARVTSSSGRIEGATLTRHPEIGGLRLTFLLVPEGRLAELRAIVRQGERVVSEVWLYRWVEG
jgi:glucans biosynthesis protein